MIATATGSWRTSRDEFEIPNSRLI